MKKKFKLKGKKLIEHHYVELLKQAIADGRPFRFGNKSGVQTKLIFIEEKK